MERVSGMQKGWPDEMLTGGKNGSLSGIGMGKHSGWTVWWESHLLQSRMESWKPVMSKEVTWQLFRQCHIKGYVFNIMFVSTFAFNNGKYALSCTSSPLLTGVKITSWSMN